MRMRLLCAAMLLFGVVTASGSVGAADLTPNVVNDTTVAVYMASIMQLAPSSVTAGSDHFTLGVTGFGLDRVAFVFITDVNGNDIPGRYIFVDPIQCIVMVPGAALVNAGTALITFVGARGDPIATAPFTIYPT